MYYAPNKTLSFVRLHALTDGILAQVAQRRFAIACELSQPVHVCIEIYNLMGQKSKPSSRDFRTIPKQVLINNNWQVDDIPITTHIGGNSNLVFDEIVDHFFTQLPDAQKPVGRSRLASEE